MSSKVDGGEELPKSSESVAAEEDDGKSHNTDS